MRQLCSFTGIYKSVKFANVICFKGVIGHIYEKVSAIVPCHNSGQWVERCVNSLLDQTIGKEDLEIVLVFF